MSGLLGVVISVSEVFLWCGRICFGGMMGVDPSVCEYNDGLIVLYKMDNM